MQTHATVSKEKEKTSGSHQPYSNPLAFVKPAVTKLPDPVEIIRRTRQNPASLSREDKLALQRTLGNRAVVQLLSSLKDSKEGKQTSEAAGAKQGEQGQGIAGDSRTEQEPAPPETDPLAPSATTEPSASKQQPQVQEPALTAQPVSEQTEPKAEQNEKSGIRAKTATTLKTWVKSLAGTSPSSKEGSKGKADVGQLAGKEKVEAHQSAEEEAMGSKAKEDGKEQPVEGKDAKDPNEAKDGQESKAGKEAKADKELKSGKEAKEAQVEPAPKGAAKEPSLGDALGALAGDGKEEPAKAKKVNIHGEDPGQILDQLTRVQPTEMGDAYAQAVDVSAEAFAKQKQKTRQGLPAIPAPTGLKGKVFQARKKPAPLKHSAPEGYRSERTGGTATTGNLERMNIGSSGSEGNPEAIMGEIRSAAAQPPGISMTGEADPSQLEGFNQEASQQVGAAKQAEMGQIHTPFGENDIYPEPDGTTVKASAELQGGNAPGAKKLPALGVPADMTAGLNRSLAPEMKKQLGAKQAEYSKEKAKFDSRVLISKADSHAQIQQAEAEAKNKQLSQQAGAKAEVDNLRGEWKNELDTAEADYAGQAGAAAQQKKGEINSVRTEKEREAQKKQSEAEREATQAYSKAKKDADGKHAEEKAKEEKKGGFLGWVKDKLEAVVDLVKKAVNFIFEGLRKAVKFIFEKAKQAVLGIIELGRKLITNLIKGLGTLLKKLVSVVFAKFPGIAAKICSKIDGVVNKAVKAVNQLAEKLKTKVTQVMDFLATKVDQALAAVQNFYRKLISSLGNLLIATFLDVLARMGALGKAAKRSLSHLEGKMWEYLLGVDISKPMGAGAAEGGAAEQVQASGQADEKLTADDIEMESVEAGEMDPALVQEANLKDGESKQLSGSRDPATMDSIMAEFDTGKADQSLGGKIADGAKLRASNAKMLFDQIKSYVIKWMKSNGLKLLAALAGILVGVVAAEIITGGAITAALPMIINLITMYLQADAIKSVAQTLVQASGYIGTYLSQGWQKMIEPAAIALATALAMGLVELAMELGFKAIGKGLNKAGQAVKKGVGAAATGAKKVAGAGVKGIKSLLKTGAKLASKSGSMIIRNGKIVIKSLQKGLMKGAKKLQGLVDRILQKFKFKRFKLERKGDHVLLYGEVNPWVLLANGRIKKIDDIDGKKAGISTQAEYDKIKSLKPSERREVYNNAVAKEDGKIDFDSIVNSEKDAIHLEVDVEFDSKLARSYIKDIEARTGRKLPKVQLDRLKDALRNKQYTKKSAKQTAKNRKEFDKVRDEVITEWESKTGQKWPTYEEDIISENSGKVIRKKGDKYDAHHIIENSFGGEHEWWNMHPAKFPDEHQGGIHGAGSPANSLFSGGAR
ncbi:HNH endonuclease [Paenibacillus sp. 22594]|uniref:HNH endonuclease n=1 Tax=Paenibacillus sp. 22594 TaxID=3453947 RepID=UPI003F879545